MSTEREGAAKCERCERMTYEVRTFSLAVGTVDGPALRWELCRRCRNELIDSITGMVSG